MPFRVPFRGPLYLDMAPETNRFVDEVLEGLRSDPKTLPSKYFYDERGSALFDEICLLDEYYPTRTEISILENHIDDITESLGDSVILVEYGSGSSIKTRLLLDAIPDATAYVPIDISREHLLSTAEHLQQQYPDLDVLPVCADYSQSIRLGLSPTPGTRISVFFPGSTIGNFLPEHGVAFMRRMHALTGRGGGLLIGVDLVKDPERIEAAYDDAGGVTAAFNRNILHHINRRADADFEPDRFRHHAPWVPESSRIEMRLQAQDDMTVHVAGETIQFQPGEDIITEFSHKYTLEGFSDLAAQAGFRVEKVWTDDQDLFSVQYLRAE